jgi:hypothetical protein
MSKEARISVSELKEALSGDVQRLLEETARAISEARAGAIIADSEEPVRAAAALFRQKLYERAVQLATDKAAKAAFSPGGACGGRASASQQGPAGRRAPDGQRDHPSPSADLLGPSGGPG